MAKVFNISFEVFFHLWESTRNAYDRGDITAEQYWLDLAVRANTPIDGAQIEFLRKVEVEIWSHPDPAMLDWVSRLQASGIKTALLSNMPLDLAAHVRSSCSWMQSFDFQTLSAEVRMIKPDPAIYEFTLRGVGSSATESLFVDDREPNIRAARQLGLHGIQFSSVAQFKKDLAVLGFPILPTVTESAGDNAQPRKEMNLQL
jgi:putative hydrolase of the HAD superfamily